jgi:hypothetical protein
MRVQERVLFPDASSRRQLLEKCIDKRPMALLKGDMGVDWRCARAHVVETEAVSR